ncbi:MAG TPA: methyltransferase domain-containing protein [Polyangia bacterium]|nr:methyltransferase domain-containing protein [Polyangia bacterium]
MSHQLPDSSSLLGAAGSTYTFGDNDVAAERLRHLAEAFAPSSRAFIARIAREPVVGYAVDLGCGPGHTTALVLDGTGARAVVGLDSSARLLARARRQAPRRVAFAPHDITSVPFPAPPADLIYGRFIVTHLAEPEQALESWLRAAAPRGRLALEETADVASDEPALARYYQLVEQMQAAHRQRMHIGRELAALGSGAGWILESSELLPVTLPGAVAARLHAMNFRTWRHDPFIAATVDRAELDRLGADLEALAAGARPAAPARWKIGQVILRRP